jgi:oligopeptide transport system permease protein
VVLVALFVILLNLVADLLSGLLDPRLRAAR